jgi:starch synthase (maltosyl-transferring)
VEHCQSPHNEGRQRVIIERVAPEIDAGRFPIKRVIGEEVAVEADVFSDGHEALSAVLRYRHASDAEWTEVPMRLHQNDRYRASFCVTRMGLYTYTIQGWVNPFRSWRRGLEKKVAAGQDVAVELQTGAILLREALANAGGKGATELKLAAEALDPANPAPAAAKVAIVLSPLLAGWVDEYAPRHHAANYGRELPVVVDPELARFSAWYELFPRSCSPDRGRAGTLGDCEALLPRIAAMGFDVLYLPPIHPIGRAFRKGRNNALEAGPDDPGSPWAIGSEAGGHKAVHPDLGTLEDFCRLVEKARDLRLEVALDIAFQCSPDHPYVRSHPQWFRHRPDGSIQYAENPPKKYQDIYPLDFETGDWRALWTELKSVFEFWIERGVRVFRVDNPHTKSFRFWEWCLAELKRSHPDLVFLSEAFTRPKVMYYLAKLGFTQSYNYFPWRNTKYELTTYLTELTQTEVRHFFRPNLWPNTPDILTQYLQYGGPPAFMSRLILAATLGASYGVYGPPYETCENRAREPGGEEYLNSEKYEVRHWDSGRPNSMSELMTALNRIRRENAALRSNESLRFHAIDNDQLIAYSKHTPDFENILVVVVNLDPRHTHRGWVELPLGDWGISPTDTYQVHELLTGARYLWTGARNYVELNPEYVPAHVLRLRRYVRTEYDFDYFL